MSKHRRFADVAGFTRHCWECVHAKHWEKRPINGGRAICDAIGAYVYKFDSPNNQCCHLPVTCDYKEASA